MYTRAKLTTTLVGVALAGFLPTSPGAELSAEGPNMALPPMSVRGIHVAPDIPSDRMRVDIFLRLQGVDLGWNGLNSLTTPGRVPQTLRNIGYSLWTLDAVRGQSVPRLRGLPVALMRDRFPAVNGFDGSLPSSELPSLGIIAEVIPGGGATAWDAGAIGGVIQYFTAPAWARLEREKGNGRGQAIDGGPLKQRVLTTGTLNVGFGELGTRSVEWNVATPTTRGIVQIQGGLHSTNGFDLLAPNQRGPVDEAAWKRGRWLETRWRQPVGNSRALTITLRGFENATGQGTPGQHREEQGTLLSLAMIGTETGGLAWHGGFFVQQDATQATLSSINSLRSIETPARRLDGMPATTFGASWTGSWWHLRDARTTVGMDFRFARGESREAFAFDGQRFQQESVAGGGQSRAAVVVLRQQPLGESVRAGFGVRLEAWDEHDGRNRTTGGIVREESYPGHRGAVLVPTTSITWQANQRWRFHANVQSSIRQPTLAERFQTWGGEGVLIEATPGLAAEKNVNFEAGVVYKVDRVSKFEAALFHNEVSDFSATQAVGSGGEILPGLSRRRRINLPRAEFQGLQLSAQLPEFGPISFSTSLAITTTRLSASANTPALNGKQAAYVPDHVVRFNARWRVDADSQVSLVIQAKGRQYADEENSQRLAAAVQANLSLSHRLGKTVSSSLRIENITGARAQTSRDANGWAYLGPSRLVRADVTYNW